eukprot:m.219502 g.219502  ORF g.219502 m.219502 type:complete len:706 (+) comp15115_c0_seq1:103-2220(+)
MVEPVPTPAGTKPTQKQGEGDGEAACAEELQQNLEAVATQLVCSNCQKRFSSLGGLKYHSKQAVCKKRELKVKATKAKAQAKAQANAAAKKDKSQTPRKRKKRQKSTDSTDSALSFQEPETPRPQGVAAHTPAYRVQKKIGEFAVDPLNVQDFAPALAQLTSPTLSFTEWPAPKLATLGMEEAIQYVQPLAPIPLSINDAPPITLLPQESIAPLTPNQVAIGNVAQPISTIAFCPTSPDPDLLYLAVGLCASEDGPPFIREASESPCNLQIWTVSAAKANAQRVDDKGAGVHADSVDQDVEPSAAPTPTSMQLSTLLCHDQGTVMTMTWCPHHEAIHKAPGIDSQTRVGLLAVGFSSGAIWIVSIPRFSTHTAQYLRLEPTLRLCSWLEIPLCMDWLNDQLVVGYGDGTVSLYQLPSRAPTPHELDHGLQPSTTQQLLKHDRAITCIAWSHNRENVFATTGHSADVKSWAVKREVQADGSEKVLIEVLHEIKTPPQPYRWWKFFLHWPFPRSGPVVAGDDELLRLTSAPDVTPYPVARNLGPTIAGAYSPWLNATACLGTAGWLRCSVLSDGDADIPGARLIHYLDTLVATMRVVQRQDTTKPLPLTGAREDAVLVFNCAKSTQATLPRSKTRGASDSVPHLLAPSHFQFLTAADFAPNRDHQHILAFCNEAGYLVILSVEPSLRQLRERLVPPPKTPKRNTAST